jgi:hypothetical protein
VLPLPLLPLATPVSASAPVPPVPVVSPDPLLEFPVTPPSDLTVAFESPQCINANGIAVESSAIETIPICVVFIGILLERGALP